MCSRIWMPSPWVKGLIKAAYDKFIQNKLPWCWSVVPKARATGRPRPRTHSRQAGAAGLQQA